MKLHCISYEDEVDVGHLHEHANNVLMNAIDNHVGRQGVNRLMYQ